MKEERDDSRKNVVLLTVIAIATMIVVLVGATFAYLASQVYSEDQANIEAVFLIAIQKADNYRISKGIAPLFLKMC